MHTIYTFHKVHHPGFFPWGLEANRLFHVHCLIVGENAMEEGRLNVEMLDIPTKGCYEMEYGTE